MAAYLVANVEVKDPQGYAKYRDAVPPIVEKFGGKYLARGGEMEQVEGDWNPARLVVLEFPSMAQVRAFYHSPEYKPLKAIRIATTISQLVLVDGL